MEVSEWSSVFGPFTVLLNVGPDEMFIRGPPSPPPLKTLHEEMDRPYFKASSKVNSFKHEVQWCLFVHETSDYFTDCLVHSYVLLFGAFWCFLSGCKPKNFCDLVFFGAF